MAAYNDVISAANHISNNYISFNGRRISSTRCANVHVFDSLMRVFDKMNTCDIDCGVSFEAKAMLSGIVYDAIITLYKFPDGTPELHEHLIH